MKILIFNSIHQVLKVESILKSMNIQVELIPVPKEIHSNCGMAVSMDNSDYSKAKSALFSKNINFKVFDYNEEMDFYMEEEA
jgi:hypothetical protein